MNDTIKLFGNVLAATIAVTMLCTGGIAKAAVISVNFTQYTTQSITNDYGITNQSSVVGGWVNLNQANNFSSLPFSDGTTSTVNLAGNGPSWAVGNGGYAGTPLGGGKAYYNGGSAASRPTVTLANLNASFPLGCKPRRI